MASNLSDQRTPLVEPGPLPPNLPDIVKRIYEVVRVVFGSTVAIIILSAILLALLIIASLVGNSA